jgi:hypothetical protein
VVVAAAAAGAELDCVGPLDALEPHPARATTIPLVTIIFPIKRFMLLLLSLSIGASIMKRCSKVVKIRFGFYLALGGAGFRPAERGVRKGREKRSFSW